MNKKQVIRFIRKNDLDVQSYVGTFFLADSVYSIYANCKGFHRLSISPLIFRRVGAHCSQISAVKDVKAIGKKIYWDYKSDKKSIDRRINEHADLTLGLENMFKEADVSKMKDKELLRFFKGFLDLSGKWWNYGIMGEDKGAVIEGEIISKYAKKSGRQEAEAIWCVLSHPKRLSVFAQERIDYLSLLEHYSRTRKLDDASFLDYKKRYFWVFTNYNESKEITRALLTEKLKSDLGKLDALKEEANRTKLENKSFNKKRSRILRTLSKEEKDDAYFAESYSYWGNVRKHGMMKWAYLLFLLVNEIAARKDVKNIQSYSINEVVDLLENNKKVSSEEIKRRSKGMIVVYGKTTKMYYGEDATSIISAVDDKILSSRTIKGLVACKGTKGNIVGKARIILDPKWSFRKGDILVTSMTRSDYVGVMRKASAIITNEGGISCHAAIISREMKIPCIIGTRNATRILKSGDLIEVDLTKGIVRRLK